MEKDDYIRFCYELGLPPRDDVLKKYGGDDSSGKTADDLIRW